MARFELLMYLALIVGFVFNFLYMREGFIAKHGVIGYVVDTAIAVGLYILAVWLVARRRKSFAKWLLLVWLGLGVLSTLAGIAMGTPAETATAVVHAIQGVTQALALWFVFSKEARPWFQKQPAIDPDIFS